jgi:hypothetical protein
LLLPWQTSIQALCRTLHSLLRQKLIQALSPCLTSNRARTLAI